MPETLLEIAGLEAGYPGKQILFGIDFAVGEGEVVTLLGANGSGKSTVLNAVSGFLRPWRGGVRFAGEEVGGRAPHEIFRRGIVQVSQARDLFPDLSVADNLRLGASVRRGPVEELLAECYRSFPRLEERAGQRVRLLSGGEQQMVALGRALMGRPRILLLDEPSGGLAPKFVNEIGTIMLGLKERGVTMLMVEQNLKLALAVADRFLILRDGKVTERGDLGTSGVSQEEIVRSIYL